MQDEKKQKAYFTKNTKSQNLKKFNNKIKNKNFCQQLLNPYTDKNFTENQKNLPQEKNFQKTAKIRTKIQKLG